MRSLFNDDGTLNIKRGDRQAGVVQLSGPDGTALDLTGYDFALFIGPAFGSTHWVVLTTPAAGLSVPVPSNGQVNYDISVAQTLTCVQGECAFDFKLLSGTADVETLLSGVGTVYDEVG